MYLLLQYLLLQYPSKRPGNNSRCVNLTTDWVRNNAHSDAESSCTPVHCHLPIVCQPQEIPALQISSSLLRTSHYWSPLAKKWVWTGAIEAFDEPSLFQSSFWQHCWVPPDNCWGWLYWESLRILNPLREVPIHMDDNTLNQADVLKVNVPNICHRSCSLSSVDLPTEKNKA